MKQIKYIIFNHTYHIHNIFIMTRELDFCICSYLGAYIILAYRFYILIQLVGYP